MINSNYIVKCDKCIHVEVFYNITKSDMIKSLRDSGWHIGKEHVCFICKNKRPISRIQKIYKTDVLSNIKLMRISVGLTQEKAAKQLCISKASLVAYERGHTRLNFNMAIKMAQLYKCDLYDFVA